MEIALLIILLVLAPFIIAAQWSLAVKRTERWERVKDGKEQLNKPTWLSFAPSWLLIFFGSDDEINIPWYAFPLAILAGLGIYAFLVFFF